MIFIPFLMGLVQSQYCTSNYEATFCVSPSCCTADRYCGYYESECIYFASRYSCAYANCEYCCYNTGYGAECGTQSYCLTWLIIAVSLWIIVTISMVFIVINRKRNIVMRKLVIQEMGQRAHQEAIQTQMLKKSMKQAELDLGYEQNEQEQQEQFVNNKNIKNNQGIDVDDGPQPKSLEDDPIDFNQDTAKMDNQNLNKIYGNLEL